MGHVLKVFLMAVFSVPSPLYAYDVFDVQICEAFSNAAGKVNCYEEIEPSKCKSGSSQSRLRCYQERVQAVSHGSFKKATKSLYSVIEDKQKRDIKRSVVVLLDNKIAKRELTEIAYAIRDSDIKSYQRTFISYYLKNDDRRNGYWATTYFDRDLKVSIHGLSIEAERKLTNHQAADTSRDIIGIWLDDRPNIGVKMTFFVDAGATKLEYSYSDGSARIAEMISTKTRNGLRIEDKGGNDFGEYFMVTQKRNLEFRNRNGRFYTAKKVRSPD